MKRVPILCYHCIGDYQNDFHRTVDDFKQDLMLLYEAGYETVSVHDVALGNVPEKAIVLTFDDATKDHFTMDSRLQPIKNCAVSLLEESITKQGGFGLHSMFFVSGPREWVRADSLRDQIIFEQKKYEGDKLRYLVEHGFEIGNHTYTHLMPEQQTTREFFADIAKLHDILAGHLGPYIEQVNTFCYPFSASLSEEKMKLVQEYFDLALTSNQTTCPAPLPEDMRYHMPRITIRRLDDMASLILQWEQETF